MQALVFVLVTAGIWQAEKHPEIQVRNMPASNARGAGWAVFVNGIELLTCQRARRKWHAVEDATRYVARQAAIAAEATQARARAEMDARNRPQAAQAVTPTDYANQLAAALMAALKSVPPPLPAEPGIEADDADDLFARVVRRVRYNALKTMLGVLVGWREGAEANRAAGVDVDLDQWHTSDVRNMVNDAARELGCPEPWREVSA